MKALLWKEIATRRRVYLAFMALAGIPVALCAMVVLSSMRVVPEDLVGFALVFPLPLTLIAAFVGGAESFARESRDNLSFLASWPISRRHIWWAKMLAGALLLAAPSGAALVICALALALNGYNPILAFNDVLRVDEHMSATTWVQPAIAVAAFAFCLMASTLVRPPIAAAGLAIVAGQFLAAMYAVSLPYLYVLHPLVPLEELFWILPGQALLLSVFAIIASWWGFVRTPVLDDRRRLGRTILACAVPMAATVAIAWLTVPLLPEPSLDELTGISVDPTGQWIASAPEQGAEDDYIPAPLWVMDVKGQHRRMLSAETVSNVDWSPTGRELAVAERHGVTQAGWQDVAIRVPSTGDVRSLDAHESPGTALRAWYTRWSPRGTYVAYLERSSLLATDRDGKVLRIGDAGERLVGWTPDETSLYLARPVPAAAPHRRELLLEKVQVRGGRRRQVAKLPQPSIFGSVSPDGRWIAAWKQLPAEGEVQPQYAMVAVEIAAGDIHSFPRVLAWSYEWSPDGRYLWCHTRPPLREDQELCILDTEEPATIRSIGREELHGRVPSFARFSPDGNRVAFQTRPPDEERPFEVPRRAWVARPDGSALKSLGKVDGELVGWTHDGDLLMWRCHTDGGIVRFNPDTGAQREIFRETKRRR